MQRSPPRRRRVPSLAIGRGALSTRQSVPVLDYQTPQDSKQSDAFYLASLFPVIGMALMGLGCCFVSGFMNDSPQVVMGTLYYTCIGMMWATTPVAALLGVVTTALAARRGRKWIWLNWIVPPVYLGITWFLMKLILPG